jgi:hypothetical protein
MRQYGLQSTQAAEAIPAHAEQLLNAGLFDHIPEGPERAHAAIQEAARAVHGAQTQLRVLGSPISPQTVDKLRAMGKDPAMFGRGGSWNRVTGR